MDHAIVGSIGGSPDSVRSIQFLCGISGHGRCCSAGIAIAVLRIIPTPHCDDADCDGKGDQRKGVRGVRSHSGMC